MCPSVTQMNHMAADKCDPSGTVQSRENVRCPTCHGIGWVHKEEEGQLVALIPLNDQRLKPRRTIIYVFLAIGLCAVAGGLCGFFLYPRDVTLFGEPNLAIIQPDVIVFGNDTVDFKVKAYADMRNENYYPVPVMTIAVSVMVHKSEITTAVWNASASSSPRVLARAKAILPVDVNFHLTKDRNPVLIERCGKKELWIHNIMMTFVIKAVYSALGHCQEVSGSYTQMVACYSATPPH